MTRRPIAPIPKILQHIFQLIKYAAAAILDIGETGVTLRSHGQTKLPRKMQSRPREAWTSWWGCTHQLWARKMVKMAPPWAGASTAVRQERFSPHVGPDKEGGLESSSPSPVATPVSPSPSLSVQVPSSHSSSVQALPAGSSFDKQCTQLPAPADTHSDNDHLTYDEPHQLRRR